MKKSLKILLFLMLSAASALAQGRYDTAYFILNAGLRPGIVLTMGDSSGGLIVDTCFSCYSGSGGSGTVTSVGFTGHQGITISGTNPITTSGTGIFGIGNGTLGDSLMATTYLKASNNLSDIISQSSARTNLGLGTSATHASTDYFLVANNLSEGIAATIKTNLSLNNVENTALSTWAGTTNITTLGTIATGVWSGTAIVYSKLALTGAILNADLAGSIAYSKLSLTGAILNADLAGSIAYSKLSLTGAILNADLAGSIAYSKLSLTGAILNADLAGSIAYSKLSLTGAILNADLAGSIAYSKLSLTGAILNADLAGSIALTKLANLSGTSLLIGSSASSAAVQEITLGTGLSMSGTTLNATAATSFANPTASLGLAAINGSASTAMRSDAAPALDVTIAPTWTGVHNFNSPGITTTYTNQLILKNATASTNSVTVQQSPSLQFLSHVWSTTSTAADTTRAFSITCVPVTSANPIVAGLTFQAGNGGTDMRTYMQLLSNPSTANLTSWNGLILRTPAAVNATTFQYSPSLVLQGNFWSTSGSAHADSSRWAMDNEVSTTAGASGLVFRYAISNGAYTTYFNLNNSGQLVLSPYSSGTGSSNLTCGSVAANYNASGPALIASNTSAANNTTVFQLTNTGNATTQVNNMITIDDKSTGTPAAGFGEGILFTLQSSTTATQNASRITTDWVTATHASRASEMKFWGVFNASSLTDIGTWSLSAATTATLKIGLASTTLGNIALCGNTSGTVTITPAAAAGTQTYTIPDQGAAANFVLSNTSGGAASAGQATLSSGTVIVSTTFVKTASLIFLTDATTGALTNVGTQTVGTIVNGTSFVINSTNVLDASKVNWIIINP